jgi:hypothetical protein
MQLAEQRDSRRIQLTGVVGAHEFQTVLERVAASSDPVLDFSAAVHIDFRAARVFARQLGRARRRARVVGLDDYCSRILRFAWTADDWDRFQVSAEERGLAGDGMDASDLHDAMVTWTDGDWEPVWFGA